MLEIYKYAAIDIGSNAVRLLISNIIRINDKVDFKKCSLVRVPIRLGEDVFNDSKVSEHNKVRLKDTMQAFRLLMKSHNVLKYKACATSAMREALNSSELVSEIEKQSGIKIDIINGKEEAKIISETDLSNYIDENKTYLYVDVGGGSTEFTIFHNADKVKSKSFKIGTVRLLKAKVTQDVWDAISIWLEDNTKLFGSIRLIGSGGNINKIFKMSGLKQGSPLTYLSLLNFHNELGKLSYEERIVELGLNQDRADVILPALEIYLHSMKCTKAKHIYVPKIGLSDGIIKSIYYNVVESNSL
jgi:exopolyphosphatase/guanosine-5'-triphosphate,3'-diphosphate pyrophosphatase